MVWSWSGRSSWRSRFRTDERDIRLLEFGTQAKAGHLAHDGSCVSIALSSLDPKLEFNDGCASVKIALAPRT